MQQAGCGGAAIDKMLSLMQFECKCPEYRDRGLGFLREPEPCKHGMALFFWLAHQVDEDPSEVFKLRCIELPPVSAEMPQLAHAEDGSSKLRPICV